MPLLKKYFKTLKSIQSQSPAEVSLYEVIFQGVYKIISMSAI